MQLLKQSLILILLFALLFLWEQTALSDYTIEAIAILIISYGVVTFWRRRKKQDLMKVTGTIDIILLNTVVLLLISITGSLYSPLYFLIYFLAFGLSFVFKPATVFVYTLAAFFLFLPEALKNLSVESFIKMGSLFLICPLAFFFGQSYKDREKQQEQIEDMAERTEDAANTIAHDVEDVIKKEKKNLEATEVKKLNEILEETEDLRRETKE